MRFCSNLRFAKLLFAPAFGAKRVGTVSESTEKRDGNSAHVLAPGDGHASADRSIGASPLRRKRDENRRGNSTRRLRTAPLAVTRRRNKIRRLIEAVGGERRIRLQEGAEVLPRRHILGGSVTLNIGKSGLVCSR